MTTQSNPAIGQLPAYFGRKYQVVVNLPPPYEPIIVTDSEWEPEALRVTFDVYMPFYQGAYWYADIVIYNADSAIVDPILISKAQSISVQLSAGYQNPQGAYDVIWSGNIFQAFLERENVVDLKLTLHCLIRLQPLLDPENVGDSFPALATQTDIVEGIAKLIQTPVAALSANIKPARLSRSTPVFGNLEDELTRIAEDNNMQWWLSSRGLNFGSITEDLVISDQPALVFSPPLEGLTSTVGPLPTLPAGTGSIIGTPQETMDAVEFTVLLDPRVKVEKPLMTVKIDNSQIRFLKRQIGQPIRPLDQDGTYVVAEVRHIGDTRGNPWYTVIKAMKRVGNATAVLPGGKF